MQLGIVQRDYPILDILSVKDLFEFINEGENKGTVHYQLSKIFYEQMVSAEALNYVRTMADEFHNCFARRLDRLDWLSDATVSEKTRSCKPWTSYWGARPRSGMRTSSSSAYLKGDLLRVCAVDTARRQQDCPAEAAGQVPRGSIYIQLCNDMPAWVNNAQYSPNFNCI